MLPDGWKEVKWAEISSIITKGATPTTYGFPFVEKGLNTARFIGGNNCTPNGKFNPSGEKWISEEANFSQKRSCLHENDIVICIVGNVGNNFLVSKEIIPANINQNVARISTDTKYGDFNYIFQCVNSNLLKSQLLSEITTQAQPSLSLKQIGNLKILLPPLPEQKKIAAILSTWDHAIEGTEQLLANSQQQKKALMQQLLTGKKRLPGFTGEWFHLPFKKVAELIYGKALPEKLPAPTTVYPVYGTGGIISYSGEYLFEGPSIIIGRKGTIDTPRYVNTPFWCIDTTFYCKSIHNNDVKFLYYSICFVKLRRYVEASGVPSLSRDTIYSIPLPLPPSLPEQQAIAAVLSAADEEIMATEADLSRLRQEKKALMQQLLTGKRRVTVD